MKILFLRRNGEGLVGAPGKYHEFEQEVGRLCNAEWAGLGWPSYRPNESMDETVKRVMPDADWVIDSDDGFKIPSERSYKVGAFISDLHGKWNKNVTTPASFVSLINSTGYNAVFLKYLYIYGTSALPDIFLKELRPKIFFLPWSVDPDKFKPLEPKEWDVTFLGRSDDLGVRYPLRVRLWKGGLRRFCNTRRLRLLRGRPPESKTYDRKISMLEDEFWVGKRYTEALGRTWFFIFGSSRHNYPLQKYFEGMSSGCVVVADEPGGAEELGFVDGETYVEIDGGNWEQRLGYFIKHPDAAKRIAENGRKLMLRAHTHEIRAKEFISMLEEA